MSQDNPLTEPARVFASPQDVLDAEGLTPEQKIHALRQWEYDAREKEVAEEENMGGADADTLPEILRALASLGADTVVPHGAMGKQGGE
jgi:hypothetical protein